MPSQISRTALFSRVAVNLVFFLLALSFLVETGVMIWEFRGVLAAPMAAFDGHLFLFFPTFGIVVLMAFRRAAIVLVDAHWRHIKGGKLFLLGVVLVISAIAGYLAFTFQSAQTRQWWEVSEPTLLADQGEPAGCTPPDCDRAPVIKAYSSVRLVAQRSESGLTDFYEDCEDENLTVFRPQGRGATSASSRAPSRPCPTAAPPRPASSRR
jgi:hypothetical protein